MDVLLIYFGELVNVFFDDYLYLFKVNLQFKVWVFVIQVFNCWLLVDGVNKLKLWFYLLVDYWYNVELLLIFFWIEEIDVIVLLKVDGIGSQLFVVCGNIGYIGLVFECVLGLGIVVDKINLKGVIDYLYYYWVYKIDYELVCMCEVQKLVVNGYCVVYEVFQLGMSEFDINQVYFIVIGYCDIDVFYSNIVVLNEYVFVLYYIKLDYCVLVEMCSFLFDVGVEYNGYVVDLMCIWVVYGDNDFVYLIKDVNDEQQVLISIMKVGISYIDYYIQFYQCIVKLLCKYQLVIDMSEEVMVENDLIGLFMLYGIGYLLGLQVYDVVGFMQDDIGMYLVVLLKYLYLCCICIIELWMVLIIEFGIYFIELLLVLWCEGLFSKYFNW